jgi:hypothetical protein
VVFAASSVLLVMAVAGFTHWRCHEWGWRSPKPRHTWAAVRSSLIFDLVFFGSALALIGLAIAGVL